MFPLKSVFRNAASNTRLNKTVDRASPCLNPYKVYNIIIYGPGSSVGIATGYGLDGLGSNPSGDKIFFPSRPALGPNQPPVQWVPGLSWG